MRVVLTFVVACTFLVGCEPAKPSSCCRVCKTGKPCGDACISSTSMCSQPPGCACSEAQADEVCIDPNTVVRCNGWELDLDPCDIACAERVDVGVVPQRLGTPCDACPSGLLAPWGDSVGCCRVLGSPADRVAWERCDGPVVPCD